MGDKQIRCIKRINGKRCENFATEGFYCELHSEQKPTGSIRVRHARRAKVVKETTKPFKISRKD